MSNPMQGSQVPQQSGRAVSDIVQNGTKVTASAVVAVSKVPHGEGRFVPTNLIDNDWTIEHLANRWVDVGAIAITPASVVGTNLHSFNLPHDILMQHSIKIPFSSFLFWRSNVVMQFTLPTVFTQSGLIKVFFAPGSEQPSGGYNRATASYLQGSHIWLNSGKGATVECTYNNYVSHIKTDFTPFTPDERPTIGTMNCMLMLPYRGATTGTTISVKAMLTFPSFKIPRLVPLTTRRRVSEDNHFFPFPPRAVMTAKDRLAYSRLYDSMAQDSHDDMYVPHKGLSSIHSVPPLRDALASFPYNEGEVKYFQAGLRPGDPMTTWSQSGSHVSDVHEVPLDCDINRAVAQHVLEPVTRFHRTPFLPIPEDSTLKGPLNQGVFDVIGSILGFGGGGSSVVNNNNYDARTCYNVSGAVSGGIRTDTGRAGDALDQRVQQSDEHDTALSAGIDATIPPMDRPDIPVPGHPVYLVGGQSLCNVSGAPTIADYMDFEAYEDHKFDLVNLGVISDEMDMRALITRPSYSSFSFTWNTATAPGTHLISIPITPCPITYRGGTENVAVNVSMCEYLMKMFAHWRGALNYYLYFSKNSLARTRIRICTDVGGLPETAVSMEVASCQFFVDLDIADDVNFYNYQENFTSNLNAMNTCAVGGKTPEQILIARHRASPGCIRIYAVTPVTSSDANPTTVDCNIYLAAGSDMMWAHPTVDSTWQPYLLGTGAPSRIQPLAPNTHLPQHNHHHTHGVMSQISHKEVWDTFISEQESVTGLSGDALRTYVQSMSPDVMADLITSIEFGDNPTLPLSEEEYDDSQVIDDNEHHFPHPQPTPEGIALTEAASHGRHTGDAVMNTGKEFDADELVFNQGPTNEQLFDVVGAVGNIFGSRGRGGGRGGGSGKTTSASSSGGGNSFGNMSGSPSVSNGTSRGPAVPRSSSIAFAGPGNGPPAKLTGDNSGDISSMDDSVLAGGGIDQVLAPVEPGEMPVDPINSVTVMSSSVDMSTLFHVTPRLVSLKHYCKRPADVCTVAIAPFTTTQGSVIDNQPVAFLVFPITTGGLAMGSSMNSWIAPMYNYYAGSMNFQITVNYDQSLRKNNGLIFKATIVPYNIVGTADGKFDMASYESFATYFLRRSPETFVANNQPCVYTSPLCNVINIKTPFNNLTSYMRPFQLFGQDGGQGFGMAGLSPIMYNSPAGGTLTKHDFLGDPAYSRYTSGFLLFGLDNSSCMDLTAIPKINVTIKQWLGDDGRYGRLWQIPSLVYSNKYFQPFGLAAGPSHKDQPIVNQIGDYTQLKKVTFDDAITTHQDPIDIDTTEITLRDLDEAIVQINDIRSVAEDMVMSLDRKSYIARALTGVRAFLGFIPGAVRTPYISPIIVSGLPSTGPVVTYPPTYPGLADKLQAEIDRIDEYKLELIEQLTTVRSATVHVLPDEVSFSEDTEPSNPSGQSSPKCQ